MQIEAVLERLSLIIERVAAVMLAAITILVVVSAAGRYLFSMPIPDAFDLSRLLIGAAIMWGFASVGYRGSHIKVELFADMLPPAFQRAVNLFAWGVLLVFTVLLCWKMGARVLSAQASGEATMDLRLSAWPVMALIWGGVLVSIFTILARLILIATGRGTLDAYEKLELDEAGLDNEPRHG
ncbi:MAG: TRAP transporter small permease [Rhizobiaceae bacterium]|nr:TRAP transporter small permease [Rhizobiaceae bacterium]